MSISLRAIMLDENNENEQNEEEMNEQYEDVNESQDSFDFGGSPGGGDGDFGPGMGSMGGGPGGKIGGMMSKVGPMLENKEMFFSMIDNIFLPHLEETLDKYFYGKYLEHRAKFFYSYYTHLKEAGFDEAMAKDIVKIMAQKESVLKDIVQLVPQMTAMKKPGF